MNINSLQKEISELSLLTKQKKTMTEKVKTENSVLLNKIALASLNIQENQKIFNKKHKAKEELENYIQILEQQASKLSIAKTKHSSYEAETIQYEIQELRINAERLEKELAYVKEEAAQRRKEVSQVLPEINNYANILAAIEEKIAENDSKILETGIEKERIRAEAKALKARYIVLKSELK